MKKPLTLLTASLLAASTFAQTNIFSYKTRNYHEVIVLSDGQGTGDKSILIDATPKILAETMPDGTYPRATNAFLIRTNMGKLVLIDTGMGEELFKNLNKIDVTPDMIDVICITHAHRDHVGALLNAEGKPAFSKAKIYFSQPEYNFYSNAANKGTEQARAIFKAYGDRITTFPAFNAFEAIGIPELDDLQAMVEPGHTPGHAMFLLDEVFFWGDLAHAMAVQMPYPTISVTYDYNNKQAIEARLSMLQFVLNNSRVIAGAHIPFPGMGKLSSDGKYGYIFTPEAQ
ncbi:MAG: MBL fold metallo-hydrolase [Bacteroidetes bacterium]|nr:MBL fold metallo-hydrolase [Bacteroidota bacterium]